MACHTGQLLVHAEGFGLKPRLFFALWIKKGSVSGFLLLPILGYFGCAVGLLVTYNCNLNYFS